MYGVVNAGWEMVNPPITRAEKLNRCPIRIGWIHARPPFGFVFAGVGPFYFHSGRTHETDTSWLVDGGGPWLIGQRHVVDRPGVTEEAGMEILSPRTQAFSENII
jgi:hypothetical protein